MFMIYILECMLLIFLEANSSSTSLVLTTTKEPMTTKDFFVGFSGWIILFVLILGVAIIIKYFHNRIRLKEKWKKQKANNIKEVVFTKKDIKQWAILFGISLFVLAVGIIVCLCVDDDIAKNIGIVMRDIGLIATTGSVLIPLFKYLWRKLNV